MPSKNILIVPTESAGLRLDVFLAAQLNITRSQVQKMIECDLVTVNGKLPKKAGDRVVANAKIEIKARKKDNNGTMKQWNNSLKIERLEDYKIETVAVEEDYIVVNKPAGLLTHPTEANEPNSLSAILVKKYPELKKVGEDPIRPGIVHRLDREASGLLVIARTQKMFNHLKQQFKNRTIDKEYVALAHGKVSADTGDIKFPIARSKGFERMAAIPMTTNGEEQEEGRDAHTEFTVEKRFVNFTLVRVKIHTGRMHQIRAHFFAYGNPIVGDPLYFQKKQKRTWDEKLGRLFLHCVKLGFEDLEGEKKIFQSTLPEKLKKFLTILS